MSQNNRADSKAQPGEKRSGRSGGHHITRRASSAK